VKVLLTLENHLIGSSDGHFYVQEPEDYSAWCELLEIFDEVVVLARVAKKNGDVGAAKRVDGPSVSVHGLPDYTGPWQYLKQLPFLRSEVGLAVVECDAYILRIPGLVSRLACQEIMNRARAYGVEVVCDPWDVMAPGTMSGSLRPVYRRVLTSNMKRMCKSSASALYWSAKTLQRRYPPGASTRTFVSPRIVLPKGFASPDLMAERLRRAQERRWSKEGASQQLLIGYVGSFGQLYKGPDTLLDALSLCRRKNLNFKALFAGDGRYRKAMESLAQDLSIGDRAVFLGQLEAGRAICDFLDTLDLFVMAPRAEGFGRAFLEAMARACPCIGSKVGSIPELIAEDDLVPSGDPEVLARKILEVANNSERMEAMAIRNLAKATQFQPERLRKVRCSFYASLRDHSRSNANAFQNGIQMPSADEPNHSTLVSDCNDI
jgi:glycosyltransferase involved in cell wall biosynthesis